MRACLVPLAALLLVSSANAATIGGATLESTDAEVSTDEMRSIVAKWSAPVLDTRPHLEWAISHIPGALNVAPKPGVLGGVMVIEPDGAAHVFANDGTSIWIDARDAQSRTALVPGARHLPRSLVLPGKDAGEIKKAKDDGRLPMEDHNTRIVGFGEDAAQAVAVAEALAREAFHNVSYFEGSADALRTAIMAPR